MPAASRPTSSASRPLAMLAALATGLALLVAPAAPASAAGPGTFSIGWARDRHLTISVSLYPSGSDQAVVPQGSRRGAGFYRATVRPGRYTVCWSGGTTRDVRPFLPRCLGADGRWVEDREDAVEIVVPSGGTFTAPSIQDGDRVLAGRVAGLVLDPDGEPVRGARVCGRVVASDDEQCSPEAVTDTNGRFAMVQLAPDRAVTLAVTTDDGLYDTTFLGDTTAPSDATVVPFEPGTARNLTAVRMRERDVPRLGGTVRDITGRAVADAVVTARTLDGARTVTARRDGAGRYLLGLEAGTYEVTTVADGFTTWTEQVEVTADRDADITLTTPSEETGTVTGKVTYRGRPLAGATVFLRTKDYSGPEVYAGLTDADGVYVRRDVKPGRYFAYLRYQDSSITSVLMPVRDWDLGNVRKFPVRAGDAPTEVAVDITFGGVQQLRSPAIVQEPVVGSWLTLYRGTWSPSAVDLRLQWMRGRDPIPGATGPGYRPVPSDVGQKLWVQVVATHRGPLPAAVVRTKPVVVRARPASVPAEAGGPLG